MTCDDTDHGRPSGGGDHGPRQRSSASIGLLERQEEQATLVALLDHTRAGRGGVAVIEGPRGIGKSSLLTDVRARADGRGVSVGMGSGGTLVQDVAFDVLRQMFQPLIDAAGDNDELFNGGAAEAAPVFGRAPVDGASEPAPGAVVHGLHWLTVSLMERLGPLVLICDDGHCTDVATLRFLAYLARRVDDLPVAVVIGTRPMREDLSGEILLRLVAQHPVRRLRPKPLSSDAVERLVRRSVSDAAPSFCRAVVDATRGNPFLVTEVVRAARVDGPSEGLLSPGELVKLDVADTVQTRIDLLPGPALDVARAVAILGPEAHPRHIAAMTGLSVDDVGAVADQLLRLEVLGPERPLSFVHPLVEAAVAGPLRPSQRSVLHREAVRLLTAEALPVIRVAPHIVSVEPAGDPEMVAILTRSAQIALAQGATELAVHQLRRALAEPPAPDQRRAVLLALAVGESVVNDPSAIDHFGEAADAIADPALRLTLVTAQAIAMSVAGRSAAGVETLRAFAAETPLPGVVHAEVLAGLTFAAWVGSVDPPVLRRCIADLRAAIDLAGDLDGFPALVLAVRALAGALSGEPQELVGPALDSSLANASPQEPMHSLWMYVNLETMLILDRDRPAAVAIERWLTPARRSGSPAQVSALLYQRAAIAFRAGALGEAEEDAAAALEICSGYGLRYVLPAPLSLLVDIAREGGDLDRAQQLLRTHDAETRPAECLFDQLLIAARARVHAARGHWDRAIGELERGWAGASDCGCASPGYLAWEGELAGVLAAAGRPKEAVPLAESAIARAAALGLVRARALALRALALAEPAGAHEGLAEATRIFDALGARLEVARTGVVALAAHDRGGPRPDAAQLGHALWLAEECGATAVRDQLRRETRALGLRSKVRPVSGVGALTASERRVASLAKAGLTNKGVAQELFISVKTVETHLARVFRMLGVSSRAELRRSAAELH
ncbi:helix-turn-helix transcriptional regulator [Desertimonas flava]|uniref:helix-turn-helix transcriptional regulator n=1 Tax=Desertimonas flava TaxID=2064846 RepID=UPI0013C4679B|nr:AAA family ATPase [Desertimonas flava]